MLGQDITITLHIVNRVKMLLTKLYMLSTETHGGVIEYMQAFRVESISSDIQAIDVSGVRHLLTLGMRQRWSELDTRPVGSVQLLIGTEKTGLFPSLLKKHDDLAVYETVLLLGGTLCELQYVRCGLWR